MELTRVFDLLQYQKSNYPRYDALAQKSMGMWKHFSTENTASMCLAVAKGLVALGVKPGDKVAIVSNNRPEWIWVDLAIQQIGAVSVPMYPTISVEDYQFIFEHAEIKVAFAEGQELIDKITAATEHQPLEGLYSFDQIADQDHWESLVQLGRGIGDKTIEELSAKVEEDDLMTVIYTSGTTGRPKGVMLSHRNIVSNVTGVAPRMAVTHGEARALSFLPLCHIYERTALYVYLYLGVSVYFAESMDKISDNILEVKPNTFNTVPRLLEKVYDRIVTKAYERTGFKRKLFFWALKVGHKYDPNTKQSAWYRYQHKWADKLVFSKWRDALGGNIDSIGCGAAALQPRLARIFWAAGIKIGEGYGLTETSPVVSASIINQNDIRIGHAGQLIDGVEVKIAEDGEILVKGPNVMLGYYNEPGLTAEVIRDGWFHTGDIGELSNEGYLKITDRKKEMFKTSGGKYIAPQLLENKFKESPYIEYIIVIGEGRKFPSALIVPNFEMLEEFCHQNEIIISDDTDLISLPQIRELFDQEVRFFNKSFGQWEKVKKYQVLDKPWGVDSGELTPTLKLKRRIIKKKFETTIEDLYVQ
ncbi:MAG: long-chain fatty acid--CoA ligase [Bacteroidota bacterium]